MSIRHAALPDGFTRGRLFLHSMPGRFEAIDMFLQEIAQARIRHVLCLAPDTEIASKSPEYLSAIEGGSLPATLWRHGMPDYGIPGDPATLDQTLDQIAELLDQGESVVIHCAAGHGRTGMASILLLGRMGMPLVQAREIIGGAGSAPDTTEQQRFVEERFRR